MDDLWRSLLGTELRRMRANRRERLEDTAARAGISPQYLSEIERGRKDASSEMIAAVLGALESNLAEVLVRISIEIDVAPVIDIRSATSVSSPSRPSAQDAMLLAA